MQSERALRLLEGNDLLEIGTAADAMRHELHSEDVVTYCLAGRADTSLADAVQDACQYGDDTVLLSQIAEELPRSVDQLIALFAAQRRAYPQVRFHHLQVSLLSAADIPHIGRLGDTGLRSLIMEIDPASPVPDAAPLLRAAHGANIDTDVIVTIGRGESLAARIRTLASLRTLQAETSAFRALAVRVHRSTSPDARREEDATAVDYLKTLGVTRLFVDTIEHLQADWSVMGPKVLELALRFGANDAGFIPRSQTGPEPSHHGGESELRRIIRDAGFRPVERDVSFRQSALR